MISGPNPRQLFEVLIVLKVFKPMPVTVIQAQSKAMVSSNKQRQTNEKPGGKPTCRQVSRQKKAIIARKQPKLQLEIEPPDRVRGNFVRETPWMMQL